LVPALRLHSWNVFPCLSAERPASPGRAASPCCARLGDLGCLGWKPNGELCMSPLQQGVLRELVLFQAAQAQLRLLQPHQGCERHGTTGGNRLLAVALVHRVNAQVVVRSAGSVAQCKTRMSSTSPSWSTRYWDIGPTSDVYKESEKWRCACLFLYTSFLNRDAALRMICSSFVNERIQENRYVTRSYEHFVGAYGVVGFTGVKDARRASLLPTL